MENNSDEPDPKSQRKISNAPKPISPLRGGYAGPKHKHYGEQSPDWAYWRQIPEADLWQAAALSCNLEPRSGRFAEYWVEARRWGDSHQDDEYQQFKERLSILTAHSRTAGRSSRPFPSLTFDNKISISEFAEWAKSSMNWRLPKKLADLARPLSIKSGTEKVKEKPLGNRERHTLLTIIAALAKAESIDWIRPSKAAGQIESLVSQLGCEISARAIEEHLKRIPTALEHTKQ